MVSIPHIISYFERAEADKEMELEKVQDLNPIGEVLQQRLSRSLVTEYDSGDPRIKLL